MHIDQGERRRLFRASSFLSESQFISIYNNIQDNNQKQQNFLKITNLGATTQQRVVQFI